jgi:RHS repeat-associated protein
VKLTGNPTGGTFTLTFNGQTTSAIAYNASAATVQSALQALSTIGSGNALVASPTGSGWIVRFAGTLAGAVQPAITGNGSGLTGGTNPSVAITVTSLGGDAGNVQQTTDPRGIIGKTDFDYLGRTVRTIEAFSAFAPSNSLDKTTEYTYDGSSNMLTLQADLASSAYEQTKFVYGVTTTSSAINSNDIQSAMQYPDKSTGNPSSSEQESYTVNAVGQRTTYTDRNGNVHTYSYDVLGRQISDSITTLGSGVDGSVRRIDTAYDTQGNAYLFTSYADTAGTTIVNQVQRKFNGLGQLVQEWQSHSGAVNTSTTPSVQYGWSLMSGGANHSRMISITYPNGKVLTYNYASGLNDSISRLTSLSDSSGTLESYSYLGLDVVVKRSHPQPTIDLTYIKQTGESNGDAGDQYTGLDRFGRVVDQRWINTTTSTATDRFKYGYDRNSNRLYRDNLVNSAFGELYHVNGSGNGYDNLNQLTAFARGTLNGAHDTISSPTHSQSWSLDAAGNFTSQTTDGTQVNRTHNKQNEVTGVGSSTLTFDKNGNLTKDDTGQQYVFDAWNRLVAVKNSGGTTIVNYKVDALGRRIVENPGTARDLYYSADWQVLEERLGGVSTATVQYVWSPVYVDALVLRDRSTLNNGTLDERLWVQQDANWTVTALANGSGSLVERYIYDSYGKQTVLDANFNTRSSSSYGFVIGFQGARLDTTSGLYNERSRDLSPTLGRWLTNDPLGFDAGETDTYRFAANNPAATIDPLGLKVTKITVEEVKKPLRGDWGVFAWPVVFKLDAPADKCGGWIIQHLKVTKTNKETKKPLIEPLDYWEAWRVQPEKDNTPKKAPSVDDVLLLGKKYIDIDGIEANDWYWSATTWVDIKGEQVYEGQVYFLDAMKEGDLPATWTTDYKPAGGLRAIETKGHEKEIKELLEKFKKTTAGPTDHNITVSWSTDEQKTKVESKKP